MSNQRMKLTTPWLSRLRLVALSMLLLLFATTTTAQETLPTGNVASAGKTSLQLALERPGDLSLRKSSLEAALMTIAELWQVNIVAGEVNGQVNGVFKQAPLREILDSVLLGNGYGYRVVGESLVITPINELGAVNPFFESTAIALRNVKPSEVASAVAVLSTPQGQIRPLDSASSLIVVDFPDRVQQIRELAQKIDAASGGVPGSYDANGNLRPLKVMYRHLQYISADKASISLDAVLSQAGRVSALDGEDRLIVADYETNLEMARTVLDHIDRPRPQVRISALIYDISLQDLEALGLNWGSNVKARVDPAGQAQTALTIDSVTKVPFAAGSTGGTITFSNLSEYLDISTVMLAVQNANDARLLADPTVLVMDNEEAIFESVSEIPFQQLTQTSAGGNIGTTAFRDAGIKLQVKPKIAADGTIEMAVTPEFSRLTGFTPGDNQPIIDRRTAATKLRVANGQTVVIGGLRQRTDVGDFSGLPGLKDLRYVGHLFRSRQTDIRESELLVFISPEIVGYAGDLSCREQRVVDTVKSRLEHIPPAEGAPPLAQPFGGDCQPCLAAGPRMLPPIADSETVPLGEELDTSSVLIRSGVAPRRLPAPASDAVPPTAEPVEPEPEYVAPPLRTSFDQRYRDNGSLHRNPEGENPTPKVTAKPSSVDSSRWWRPFR